MHEGGGTLRQAWDMMHVLTGTSAVCLLATERPKVSTKRIKPLIKMNSKELIITIGELQELPKTAVTLAIYDGKKGHVVSLRKHYKENSTFIYHETWPDSTFLRKGNNLAGVEAKRVGRRTWSVTEAELERVIFAAFVWPPHYWGDYTENKYYITHDEFVKSDFWSFFHIREIGRHDMTIDLKPGGPFQSEIDLNISLNNKQQIQRGSLNVKRRWIESQNYPYALDIIRSFVKMLVCPLDKDAVPGLDPFQQIGDILARVRSETEYTSISVTNNTYNDAEWVSINVNNLLVDNF